MQLTIFCGQSQSFEMVFGDSKVIQLIKAALVISWGAGPNSRR